jgi:heat shock protein HslJ
MKLKLILSISLSAGLIALSACSLNQNNKGGDLTGQTWLLSELSGKPVISGSIITAQFSSEGKLSGTAGCNRYMGSYSTSGNKLTISAPLASTLMMCEADLMTQETEYLNALGEAKSYSVSGDQLTLFGTGGKELAIYHAQTQELAGTSWQVITYNNGKQAVTSVLNGTTLTAEFGTDGTLSGNGGCNTYSGSYKVNGNEISIGPLASTKKFCNDPAGIMEQETQLLAALQTASTYLIEGNSLELRTQDGALAAEFSKKQ